MQNNNFCKNCKYYNQLYDRGFANYFRVPNGVCLKSGNTVADKDGCDLWEKREKIKITVEEIDGAIEEVKLIKKLIKKSMRRSLD